MKTASSSVLAFALVAVTAIHGLAWEAKVSGLGEIIVFKPETDATGRSVVKMVKTSSGVVVEFAPTIHIHRNFYAGDKSFQGPLVRGGRTIVVARHPFTGEPVYVDANLPGGAPRVYHHKNSIEYVYRDRRVAIRFHKRDAKRTTVKVVSGRGFFRSTRDLQAKIVVLAKGQLRKSQTVNALHGLSKKGAQQAVGVVSFVDKSLGSMIEGLNLVTSFIPGGIQADGMAKESKSIRADAAKQSATRSREKARGIFGLFK